MNLTDLRAAWIALGATQRDEGAIKLAPLPVEVAGAPLLAGVDGSGRLHLLAPVPIGTPVRTDRGSTGVVIERNEYVVDGARRPYVDVICEDLSLGDVFQRLAADMVEAIDADPTTVTTACHEVLARWRDLLNRRRSPLSAEAVAGLWAELVLLERLVTLDPSRRIDAWVGPSGAVHDFRRPGLALEVKASRRREGRSVEIHGIEQLDSAGAGRLYLRFTRVAARDDGRTISDVIHTIKGLGADGALLDGLVAQAGWQPTDDDERLAATETRLYEVDAAFPKVVRSTFVAGDLPAGVLMLRYSVDLAGPAPVPLSPSDAEAVLAQVATT